MKTTKSIAVLALTALAGIASIGIAGCTAPGQSEQLAPSAAATASPSKDMIETDLEGVLYGQSFQDGTKHVIVVKPDGSATQVTAECNASDSHVTGFNIGAREGDRLIFFGKEEQHFEETETGFTVDAQEFTHADPESKVCA